MTRPDNFIQRWARMKRGLDTAPEPGVAGTSLPSAAAEAGAGAATAEPFDPASLPSIESIVADTDIGVFLRSGVPAELTRAALRRAWASDPAIRDFIGIAENQWDFNDPDAIPGFGPLLATDNAPAVLTQVASKLENVPAAFLEAPPSLEPPRPSVTDPSASALDHGAELTPDEPRGADPGVSSLSNELSEARAEAERARPVEEDEPSRKSRRHGSALPR
jgi:hypothetical protein